MTSTTPQVFEPTPSISFHKPHDSFVNTLVELNDGSFLSCSSDNTAKRWSRTSTNNLQLLGTYQGHEFCLRVRWRRTTTLCSLGHYDGTVKVWNTTTCECLKLFRWVLAVYCLLKTKDKRARFVCGLYGGELR